MNKVIGMGALAFFIWLMTSQAQAAKNRIDRALLLSWIRRENESFGGFFDPLDVLAIIEVESARDPDAYRYEKRLNDASIGLMQILYTTARDRGYTQGPAGLFDPEANIRYGMRQLRWSYDYLLDRLGQPPTMEQWIGSYNAGVGNVMKGHIPLGYVQKWAKARDALEAEHG